MYIYIYIYTYIYIYIYIYNIYIYIYIFIYIYISTQREWLSRLRYTHNWKVPGSKHAECLAGL